MSNQTTTPPRVPLKSEEFEKIAGALHRLNEIKTSSIIDPKYQAEVEGLIAFLADQFISHGSEFLGCWMAVKHEYEPLINLVAGVQHRVQGVIRQAALRNAKLVQTNDTASKPGKSHIVPQPEGEAPRIISKE